MGTVHVLPLKFSVNIVDFYQYNTRCLLFTGMTLHICYVPLSSTHSFLFSHLNACHSCLLTSPQEFIRHKLEEEQRQLEILQQQLLQEQALLMVTSPHYSSIMSCFDCRGFHVPSVTMPHQ